MTYKAVPYNYEPDNQHRRLLAEAINNILAGRMNVTGEVTLAVSATSTTITDLRIRAGALTVLQPMTANAAAAMTVVYIPEHGNEELTIQHDSDSATDRTFRYAIIG